MNFCNAINFENTKLAIESYKNIIKGKSASPGFVRGKCRIVKDPFAEVEFNHGDILVAGMTRPDYIKFYDRAAAIVTDAGGKLSHAALIAMEMNIPCVVGTEDATRILNEGDMVEVDATKGIIRKI